MGEQPSSARAAPAVYADLMALPENVVGEIVAGELVDPILAAVTFAVAGAAIVLVLGKPATA